MKIVPEQEKPREFFRLVPVEGRPNVYAMHFEKLPPPDFGEEMTEADWDKFEQDIAHACEQVP